MKLEESNKKLVTKVKKECDQIRDDEANIIYLNNLPYFKSVLLLINK